MSSPHPRRVRPVRTGAAASSAISSRRRRRDGTGSSSNVYRVLDSLEDPDDEIWLDFATLVSDDKEGGGRQDGPWGTAYW